MCDYENNRITLGDMTNKNDCIFIDLPSGGALDVNKNAMSSLADSMEMFSPANALNSVDFPTFGLPTTATMGFLLLLIYVSLPFLTRVPLRTQKSFHKIASA